MDLKGWRNVIGGAAVLVGAFLLGACGSGNGATAPPPPPAGWTELGNGVAFTCHGHDGVYANAGGVFVLAGDPQCP